MEMGRHTVVQRVEEIVATAMDDMTVILDVDKGFYYGMDEISSRIWELMAGPVKVEDLIAQLLREYEAAEEQLEGDVLEFLEHLLVNRLLTVS